MNEAARGTLPRSAKGRIAPPPAMDGALQVVVDAVAGWPGVDTTVHWHFADPAVVDGVDFYVGDVELGHLHLEGAIHLATRPSLGRQLIEAGKAKRFRFQQGWVEEDVGRIGTTAAISLFRCNFDDVVLRRGGVA